MEKLIETANKSQEKIYLLIEGAHLKTAPLNLFNKKMPARCIPFISILSYVKLNG